MNRFKRYLTVESIFETFFKRLTLDLINDKIVRLALGE